MSYDIRLVDPVSKETLQTEIAHEMRGGTYAVGGTKDLWLNVTYNYAEIIYRVLSDRGIRRIEGMTGAESIPILEDAINQLGDDTDPDYWKATEGNVKRALCQLLALARLRPDGVWEVT